MRLWLGLLVAVTLLGPAYATKPDVDPVDRVVETVVRPGFAFFAKTSAKMKQAAQDLCTAPDEKGLTDVRAQFARTVDAWSRIELIRLGPLSQDQAAERILFWPDRSGIALRQVQAALAERAADVTDPVSLAEKSVALQGLGTLDYLLFGTGSDALASGDDHRCVFASAVSTRIATTAADLLTAWNQPNGFADIWTNPGPSNRAFRTGGEALGALLKQAAVGFEIIRDLRVRRLVAPTGRPASHKRALYWRSNQTLPSIRANIEGLGYLLEAADLTALLDEDDRYLVTNIDFDLGNARRIIDRLDGSLENVVASESETEALAYLMTVLGTLQNIVGTDIAAALGTGTGFSSMDGD